MKKILAIAAFGLVLAFSKGYSQQESYMSIQYPVSFGIGDLGDYISAVSFRGMSMEFRVGATSNIFFGADVAWILFYEEKPYDTYEGGTASLSGRQFRYQNEVPLMAAAEYHFSADKSLNPYIALGIGTMYTERATDMGLWRLEENPWHFALRPEAGILYEINYGVYVKASVKYFYGFGTNELDSQGFISICAGMAFTL